MLVDEDIFAFKSRMLVQQLFQDAKYVWRVAFVPEAHELSTDFRVRSLHARSRMPRIVRMFDCWKRATFSVVPLMIRGYVDAARATRTKKPLGTAGGGQNL